MASLTTHEKLGAFYDWARRNPDALRVMYAKALALHYTGHRFSVKYLMEWLRYEGWVRLENSTIGAPEDAYKLPNAWAPIIARIFVQKSPELEREIQLNKSEFDNERLEVVF